MSTTPPAGPQPGAGARKPSYVLVAAILALVVALLLGGGLFLSRKAQPSQRAAQPTAFAVPTAQPASPQPTPSIPPSVGASSAGATTNTPASAAPSASVAFKVASTPLEREIEAAYLHYWDVRSDALWSLDSSHLSEVMAGAELTRDIQQVQDLKAQNRALKIDITHKLAFLQVSDAASELYDEYFNKSYYVDAATKQPIGTPGPGGVAKITYNLQKVDGTWKVTDGSRLAS